MEYVALFARQIRPTLWGTRFVQKLKIVEFDFFPCVFHPLGHLLWNAVNFKAHFVYFSLFLNHLRNSWNMLRSPPGRFGRICGKHDSSKNQKSQNLIFFPCVFHPSGQLLWNFWTFKAHIDFFDIFLLFVKFVEKLFPPPGKFGRLCEVRTTARSRPSVSPKAEARGEVRGGAGAPPGTLFHPGNALRSAAA